MDGFFGQPDTELLTYTFGFILIPLIHYSILNTHSSMGIKYRIMARIERLELKDALFVLSLDKHLGG